MTVREKLEALLVEHGLWEKEATQVMDLMVQDYEEKHITVHWSDSEDDYPSTVVPALFLTAKAMALDWIDKNAPLHFARGILDSPEAFKEAIEKSKSP